jgi:hypothetical protein
MLKIPIAVWIANAAACLTGTYGDVTRQAEAADCSRQTVYDHAQKVQAAVAAEHSGGPTHAELIQENEQLRQENARLWDWLAQAIEFPASKQHEFTVTAIAMGLSLNQVLTLLALILGTNARPGRSTIQRRIQAAGQKAACVLKHLDRQCRTLVLVGCLDEIFFHRRPILVGVEPTSMVWFLGQTADDRRGATWFKAQYQGSCYEVPSACKPFANRDFCRWLGLSDDPRTFLSSADFGKVPGARLCEIRGFALLALGSRALFSGKSPQLRPNGTW